MLIRQLQFHLPRNFKTNKSQTKPNKQKLPWKQKHINPIFLSENEMHGILASAFNTISISYCVETSAWTSCPHKWVQFLVLSQLGFHHSRSNWVKQSTDVTLVLVITEKRDILGFETIRFLSSIPGPELYFIKYILYSSINEEIISVLLLHTT